MLMMLKDTGALVELQAPEKLWNPFEHHVMACRLAGEEMQEPESFNKSDLAFLSGESMPKCWLNPHYRDERWQDYRDPIDAASAAGPTSYYGA